MGWVDKLTGMIARLEKNFKELDSFYQEIIDVHLLDPNRQEPEQEDITNVLDCRRIVSLASILLLITSNLFSW